MESDFSATSGVPETTIFLNDFMLSRIVFMRRELYTFRRDATRIARFADDVIAIMGNPTGRSSKMQEIYSAEMSVLTDTLIT